MNNILTTKTVFDTDKLNRGLAIHIIEYMKNDTNHLIRSTDALIMNSDLDSLRIIFMDNGTMHEDVIYVKDIKNGNVEISFLKEV